MANNSSYVSVGKPLTGGAVFMAPAGTTVPTSASGALDNAFVGMGYISEDGVTNNNERTTENIKAWGGDIVLTPQTEKTDTFGMTFIESLNSAVLEAVYGGANVSGDLTTEISVKSNAQELERTAWVIDMVMTDGYLRRVVIPNGQVTAVAEVTYNDSTAIGYNVTITAFPDASGDTHHEYIKAQA